MSLTYLAFFIVYQITVWLQRGDLIINLKCPALKHMDP